MHTKINGYYLDKNQEEIVLDNTKHLLVVAGAGSGKTLTILGKIGYLLKEKNINPDEILCISFTRKASISLEEKIKKEFNISVPVYTFHKLSLEILKDNNYKIASSDTLDNIIHLFFYETVLNYKYQIILILKYFNKSKNTNYYKFLEENEKEITILEKLLSTFIHLFKCNNYDISDFKIFFKKIKYTFSYKKYKKEKIFLLLALNIYLLYRNYLKENNEIDFDDMIINATIKVKENGYYKNIKYLIIDEYQDTSFIRFNLVKEILNSTNSNLMVVGDDFQSIYRFTGCDIDLFINFKKYFKDSKIMKIENTYRNSKELISVAGSFVMKNKKQIRKNLKSNKTLNKPIKIIYYSDIKKEFKKLIEEIYSKTNKEILILGRNNNDINLILDKDFKLDNDNLIYLKNSNIKLTYLTTHKAKGLESNNVIIINLSNNYLGFPSKIKEDDILRLVTKSKEKYPYSEERRLFYVALTRTKNYVYLLVPRNNPSIFIKELEKDYYRYIN